MTRYIHIDQPEHFDDEVEYYEIPSWVQPDDVVFVVFCNRLYMRWITDATDLGQIVAFWRLPDPLRPPGWTKVQSVTSRKPS